MITMILNLLGIVAKKSTHGILVATPEMALTLG